MSEIRGQVGDIWRFDAPYWEPTRPIRHYLITAVVDGGSHYERLYAVIELETGRSLPDLLLDESNVTNYRARKVA